MTVIFQTKSPEQNRYTIMGTPFGNIVFTNGGSLAVSEKDKIEYLLGHPLKKRGDYHLVTNAEVVDAYLEGNEVDVLTKEVLDGITRQGILELGKLLGTVENQPNLIKPELIGEPVTNEVKQILDFYRMEKTIDEVSEDMSKTEKRKPKGTRVKKETEILDA